MAAQLPEFKHTSVEAIPGIVGTLRTTFNTQKTKPLEFRLVQLRKLYWAITDAESLLVAACKSDLGKPTFETYISEIDWVKNDIVFVCQNLAKWARDESAPDIPLTNKLISPTIRKDPLGCVLIIGAYNFPIQLSIGPLIGAIAAGNTALLKPSENAPAAAAVMQSIIASSLDPSCYAVAQGAVPETSLLLDQKWDKIFYTGGAAVGKIIAKKAAETLTPVTLELGGKNPAIVTRNANMRLAARRLLWGKLHNAGQVCTSQNYVLVDKEVGDSFLRELKVAWEEFFPGGDVKASEDFGRVVNERQWKRLKAMIDNSKGRIVLGGTMDEAEKFLEPTVVVVEDATDSLIVEESFGPIIPVLMVSSLDEAIRIANEVHDTPLGAYPFGTKQEVKRIMQEVRSGGASVNDAFFHASIPTLSFGGVGDSGVGAYRGKESFECFSHRRSFTTTPGWMEKLIAIRYPPYKGKLEQFQKMSSLKPDFDREGKVTFSIVRFLMSLGAESTTGGALRYAVVLIAAIGVKQYLDRRAKL